MNSIENPDLLASGILIAFASILALTALGILYLSYGEHRSRQFLLGGPAFIAYSLLISAAALFVLVQLEDMQLVLFVVGTVSTVFSLLYGVFATLYSFYSDQEGRRVITHYGKVGIVFFTLNALLSIGTGVIQFIRGQVEQERLAGQEREKEARHEAEYSRLKSELAGFGGTVDARYRTLTDNMVEYLTEARTKEQEATRQLAEARQELNTRMDERGRAETRWSADFKSKQTELDAEREESVRAETERDQIRAVAARMEGERDQARAALEAEQRTREKAQTQVAALQSSLEGAQTSFAACETKTRELAAAREQSGEVLAETKARLGLAQNALDNEREANAIKLKNIADTLKETRGELAELQEKFGSQASAGADTTQRLAGIQSALEKLPATIKEACPARAAEAPVP